MPVNNDGMDFGMNKNGINSVDPGAHYRYTYKGIKLDPFRIGQIYGITSLAMFTILKKCLCAGNRGA
ncbi:MAG: hypothetical protein ACXV8O_01275 [Methylobacter sp.]